MEDIRAEGVPDTVRVAVVVLVMTPGCREMREVDEEVFVLALGGLRAGDALLLPLLLK